MKNKKIVIGSVIGGVVLLAACGFILFKVLTKEDAYRVIKVLAVDGHTYVNREEIGELESYEGMALQSGDIVRVDGNSTMTLMVDEDKVCYVDENTQFSLIAEGTNVSSKTLVKVDYGTMTWDVQNKLSADSTFDIQTPNSTMAIRGTVPNITVGDDTTKKYDSISKFALIEGKVDITYFDNNGNQLGTIDLVGGQTVQIGSNKDTTEVISKEDKVDLSSFSKNSLEALETIFDGREEKDMGVSRSDVSKALNSLQEKDFYTVVFMTSSQTGDAGVFAKQEVANGGLMQIPSLQPTEFGSWDVDFSKEVKNDLIIYWLPQ